MSVSSALTVLTFSECIRWRIAGLDMSVSSALELGRCNKNEQSSPSPSVSDGVLQVWISLLIVSVCPTMVESCTH